MQKKLHILLADDDHDDRFFFAEALNQLPIPTTLVTVNDGEKLIDHLINTINQPPDILFLDINMPRKKGSDCLIEIKGNKNIQAFPIVIYSTFLNETMVDEFYAGGAHCCLRKGNLSAIVKSLRYILNLLVENNFNRYTKEHFIIDLQKV